MDAGQQQVLNERLCTLAYTGKRDGLRALLTAGADINALEKGVAGMTPLRIACAAMNWDAAAFLLEQNADVTPKCGQGISAFHFAVYALADTRKKTPPAIVEALMDRNPNIRTDINNCVMNGWRPVQAAVVSNHFELAEKMIAKGADINAMSSYHETCLVCAVRFGTLDQKLKAVAWLFDHGADPMVEDNKGLTVFDWITDPAILDLIDKKMQERAQSSVQDAADKRRKAIDAIAGAIEKTARPARRSKCCVKKTGG